MKNAPEQVTFLVNGRVCQGRRGEGLLAALRRAGYEVPSLCYHPKLSALGACRLCLVEVLQGDTPILTTSCNYPVEKNVVVYLDSPRVQRNRRVVLELLLAMTDEVEYLRALAARFKVQTTRFTPRRRGEKCIACGLCTRVCREVVKAEAIAMAHRGEQRAMERAPFGEFPESCIGCGACAYLCPTGAISMEEIAVSRLRQAWSAERPCRYALMGLAPGTVCENDYACGRCEFDQRMIDRAAGDHPVFLKLQGR